VTGTKPTPRNGFSTLWCATNRMAQKLTMGSILRTIRELSEREDGTAQIPDCEQCGFKMNLLATLAQICDRPTLNVFRCVPCNRIASTPRI
jgi:hypothetical protein